MFIANSCTKESELSKEDAIQLRTDLTPEQRVTAITPVVNGTFNPAKTYTGAEAVLGVETVLNYEYGDFSRQFDETYSLKDTFAVNKQNGVITDQVVAAIYNQALQLMKCHYASIQKTNKAELLADLNLVSENSSQIQIQLNNLMGTASAGISPNTKSFVAGDNWKANYGKCNDPENPSNAPQQIAKYANWNLVGLFQQQAGVWYSDFVEKYYDQEDNDNWFRLNPNDPFQADFVIDYFQWKFDGCDEFYPPNSYFYDKCWEDIPEMPMRIEANGEIITNPEVTNVFCIDWPEMNYYLANAQYEAKKFEPILNKVFLNIEMDWGAWINVNSATYASYWWGIGKYGKKNVDITRVVQQLGPCN
jgi:hypothetical protein